MAAGVHICNGLPDAVIARPYTLLPLLCFLVAILFKDLEHPVNDHCAPVALIMLTLHGTIWPVCFGALYLLAAFQSWSALDQRVRARYFLCAGVIVFAFLLLFVILKRTPDVEEFAAKKEVAQLLAEKKQELNIVSPFAKVMTITSGAFWILFPPPFFWRSPQAGFERAAGSWCLLCRWRQ